MADNQRWFKLWCSAPADDDIQSLDPAIRWAWAAFGVHTKAHGNKGRVKISASNKVLAAEMGVAVEDLFNTIKMLPHMTIQNHENVNGEIVVTWNNWIKYQEDSTVTKRQKEFRSRSKKRREEKRGEESIKIPESPSGAVDNLETLDTQAFKKEVEAMWKKVQYITSKNPDRFTSKLAAWAGRKIQDGWQPKDIRETLEEFVRFEDGHSKVEEFFPYLNSILQKRKTREHQASSEQHKQYDPQSAGAILKKMTEGKINA